MHLDYLREFIEIANMRSISGAARELNISQPVLSKHVQSLEKELDAKLLERMPGSVGLTRAGRLFLSSAEEVLSIIENLKAELAEETAKDEVVVCGNTRPYGIRNLVAAVAREVPYGVRFATGAANERVDFISQSTSVVGFITLPRNPEVLESLEKTLWIEKTLSESIVAVVDAGHPLAMEDSIEIAQLRSWPFIHISEGPGSENVWKIFEYLCGKRGFVPRSRLYFIGLEPLHLTNEVFLLPADEAVDVSERMERPVRLVPLTDEDACIDTYIAVGRKSREDSSLDFFTRCIERMRGEGLLA